jgi:SAM-dependent methyltransferase
MEMRGRQRAKNVYVAKSVARRLRWAVPDLIDGRRGDSLTPPRGLAFVGGGDFERTGQEVLSHFTRLGGLVPESDVLDVGCGIGRMAVPLLSYLNRDGSYAGFDVGKEMVRWCQTRITAQRADFRFTWAPVFNRKYNPFGELAADDYRFPYADDSFDFVFATSLFTHLVLPDAAHDLSEISRVLRPTGRAFLTFFILRPEAIAEIDAGRVSLDFRHPIEGGRTIDPLEPEAATAFYPSSLDPLFADAALTIQRPISYGHWANAPDGLAGQDIVLSSPARPSETRS